MIVCDSLNKLGKEIHHIAKSKGWWDVERNPLEIAALIHSEISEFVEVCREPNGGIKEQGTELLDSVIRILDWMTYMGYDIDRLMEEKIEINRGRPYRHGNKRY